MKIRMMTYAFGESFKNVWRNRAMSIASASSVAATLVILGVVFMLITNINSIAQGAKEQFDSVIVYLVDDLNTQQTEEIGRKITQIQGVKSITYENKDEALAKYKQKLGQNGSLFDDLEGNPLPNSYAVYVTDLGQAMNVVEQIKTIKGIEEIKYYQDTVEKIISVTVLIRNIGLTVIIALIAVSTLILSNTIKLAIIARKREINIMKYVGATSWFVRWPFVLEGTLLGLLGSIIAIILVFLSYKYVFDMLMSQFYFLIAAYLVDVNTMIGNLIVLFLVIGTGIGAVGSLISLRKHLEV